MSCSQYGNLYEALTQFDRVSDVVICPFTSDAGLGLGMAMFVLFVGGFLGMGLTIRTQHPGPVVVSGILSASLIAGTMPGAGARIYALILFFGIAAIGVYIYSRARTTF